MARPRKVNFVVFNVVSNEARMVGSFVEGIAVVSPDNPSPGDLVLSGISPDGTVKVATVGDWRIVRL